MPMPIARLRRWFAVGAIFISLLAVGAYFIARWRMRNALREIPKKIGFEVQQSAQGFTISRSEQGRTIFTVRASKAVQFKQGGRSMRLAFAVRRGSCVPVCVSFVCGVACD